MKIFHTGDWHIGKLVNGYYMTEDQEYIIEQLCEKIVEEKPDVLVIAGDIYDRSIPPVEAVALLDRTLKRIIGELNTPIIAISGNHDSNERMDFGNSLYEKAGFYISGELKREVKVVTLNDEFGKVNFYLIPYADPYYIKKLYEDEDIKTHEDAAKAIVKKIEEKMDKNERNIAVFHGYVSKGGEPLEESDSEKKLSIGGTDIINSNVFEPFNYVALGHIHRPLRVDGDRISYPGSLMKYSFSEVKNKVGISKVIIDGEGNLEVSRILFNLRRDYRELEGTLEELINKEFISTQKKDDYIKITLTDKGQLIEPMAKLRAVYPNIMELRNKNQLKDLDMSEENLERLKEKSLLELIEDFFGAMREEEITEDELDVVKTVLEEVEREAK